MVLTLGQRFNQYNTITKKGKNRDLGMSELFGS